MLLDVYFTKTGTNTWEVAVYNQANAAPGTSFPYTAGPLAPAADAELRRHHRQAHRPRAPTDITIPVPGGVPLHARPGQAPASLRPVIPCCDSKVDGNAPSGIDKIEIGEDGTVYAQYENGSFKALYRIPIATVQSPDQLNVEPGNVYSQSSDSGDIRIGFANEGGMGSVVSGALENSNVDIAEELTNMIELQRTYTANSKVFQTGADLMDILVNLKR